MADYDVMIYINSVYVAQATSYDYSFKPTGDKKETFEGILPTTGPTEVEVKVSKVDVRDTSYPALRDMVLKELNEREDSEIVIVDLTEEGIFTGVKYSDFSVKRDPKTKDIDMSFTARGGEINDI